MVGGGAHSLTEIVAHSVKKGGETPNSNNTSTLRENAVP